jgi:hypothetical protein
VNCGRFSCKIRGGDGRRVELRALVTCAKENFGPYHIALATLPLILRFLCSKVQFPVYGTVIQRVCSRGANQTVGKGDCYSWIDDIRRFDVPRHLDYSESTIPGSPSNFCVCVMTITISMRVPWARLVALPASATISPSLYNVVP